MTKRDLSPRELEVLQHMCRGECHKIIARHLGITDRTVEAHAGRVREKLGVSTALQAVIAAFRQGIVPLDEAQEAAA